MGKLSESDFMAQLVEAANISVDQAKNLLILLNVKLSLGILLCADKFLCCLGKGCHTAP